MAQNRTITIAIPSSCVTETSTLSAVSWQFGTFLSGLEKQGVGWHELPDDLREIGSLNTSCGGHRSNGSRTSLRNLVVLEGIEFARAFLEAANKGAQRLGWKMADNPFLAELEWLDLIGDEAARLLDDYEKPLHLLNGANAAFFRSLRLSKYARDEMLEPLTADLKERFERAEQNRLHEADGHYTRIYLYVMGHPSLEIVQPGDGEDELSLWNKRIEECARSIKASRSFRDSIPMLNRLRNRKYLH